MLVLRRESQLILEVCEAHRFLLAQYALCPGVSPRPHPATFPRRVGPADCADVPVDRVANRFWPAKAPLLADAIEFRKLLSRQRGADRLFRVGPHRWSA